MSDSGVRTAADAAAQAHRAIPRRVPIRRYAFSAASASFFLASATLWAASGGAS
jgi:hypothetical protein